MGFLRALSQHPKPGLPASETPTGDGASRRARADPHHPGRRRRCCWAQYGSPGTPYVPRQGRGSGGRRQHPHPLPPPVPSLGVPWGAWEQGFQGSSATCGLWGPVPSLSSSTSPLVSLLIPPRPCPLEGKQLTDCWMDAGGQDLGLQDRQEEEWSDALQEERRETACWWDPERWQGSRSREMPLHPTLPGGGAWAEAGGGGMDNWASRWAAWRRECPAGAEDDGASRVPLEGLPAGERREVLLSGPTPGGRQVVLGLREDSGSSYFTSKSPGGRCGLDCCLGSPRAPESQPPPRGSPTPGSGQALAWGSGTLQDRGHQACTKGLLF